MLLAFRIAVTEHRAICIIAGLALVSLGCTIGYLVHGWRRWAAAAVAVFAWVVLCVAMLEPAQQRII